MSQNYARAAHAQPAKVPVVLEGQRPTRARAKSPGRKGDVQEKVTSHQQPADLWLSSGSAKVGWVRGAKLDPKPSIYKYMNRQIDKYIK